MARRPGGVGRRRIVPGIRAGLIARARFFDATFCRRGPGRTCGWCEMVAALEAGEPFAVSGDLVWSAARANVKPNDLIYDAALYSIVGADVIEGVGPA